MLNLRHMPNIHSQQVRRGKKLRRWRLWLPVWTTSIFIAFENAIMSVISTDYTTFFFLLSVSTDTEWWNYSWCQGMSSFYALSKQNKKKKNSCYWQHISTEHHAHSPGCTISTQASGSCTSWELHGARIDAFGIVKSHSRERKAKPTLRNIRNIQRVYC